MQLTLRHKMYEIVEPGLKNTPVGALFTRTGIICIVVSVALAVMSTLPGLTETQRAGLRQAEFAFGGWFVLEYLLRLYTAAEHPLFSRDGTLRGTLRYAATPLMLLDLAGLIPLILLIAAPRMTPLILLFQVLRFFRLSRYSPALATVGRVLVAEWRSLMATGLIGLGMLLVSSTAMYLLEHGVQPEKFASIPDAMYWAIVTLATVGYGDVVPITGAGKIASGFVIIAGLIFFALPIAIIASSFLAEMRRREFNISYGMVARVPLFASLEAIAISELASMLKARKVPRDAVILRKGDEGESMFFILQGKVEVVVPDGEVILRQGDFFGEMAVIGRMKRSATVIARQACELLVLDAGDLLRLMDQNPAVERVLMDEIAARKARISQG